MSNDISLNEAVKKAIKIKKSGGQPLYVELSNSIQDPINRVIQKSNELINKLSFEIKT